MHRLDLPLDTTREETREHNEYDDIVHDLVKDPITEAMVFLKRFERAKIVVILDTHSVENGAFVWVQPEKEGEPPKTCYMLEVSPHEPYRLLYSYLADYQPVHPTPGLQVLVRCKGHPLAWSQEHHHQPRMWLFSEQLPLPGPIV